MYHNFKIVVNTAAGRRRYMQYLVPPILNSDIVDRYDIWINTNDGADIEFFKRLAHDYPKINLVWQPDGILNGIQSINAFYGTCVEDDTIYMKLDDDVVWFEPQLFEKMVRFRVDNPDYFIVSPLVINNALSTYLLQLHDKIGLDQYYDSRCAHPILCHNGYFASALHNWFMDNYLKKGEYDKLYVGPHPFAMTRFSINCILWFGSEMKKFGGEVPGDDEEFISCIKPTQLGKLNCINGDALISHFAFGLQREILDKCTILEKYGEILHKQWVSDDKLSIIDNNIQAILAEIKSQEQNFTNRPAPYKNIAAKPGIGKKMGKYIPVNIRTAVNDLMSPERKSFILK
jgi:hypothetical protein